VLNIVSIRNGKLFAIIMHFIQCRIGMWELVHRRYIAIDEYTKEYAHRPSVHTYKYGLLLGAREYMLECPALPRGQLVGGFTSFNRTIQVAQPPALGELHEALHNVGRLLFPLVDAPADFVEPGKLFGRDTCKGSYRLMGTQQCRCVNLIEGDVFIVSIEFFVLLLSTCVQWSVYYMSRHE